MSQPVFQGIDVTYKSGADNKDIRDLLEQLVPEASKQMREFSLKFKAASEKETCKKIFDYLKKIFLESIHRYSLHYFKIRNF